jgi:aldehyde:ferredoxin oxidoreductase
MLYEEVDPTIDHLSPDNKLIFATGPLTGTAAISGARYMVVTKSPLFWCIACSNSGGNFGPELKFAGYDLVILEDKSPMPVYIVLANDVVEIKPARHLWGKSTVEIDRIIRSDVDGAKVANIGPAGKKLVKMACIVHGGRSAGRSGTG